MDHQTISTTKKREGHGYYSYAGFEVYRCDGRRWNRTTGNNSKVSFWCYHTASGATNSGYGTKREAIEAARKLIATAGE